MPELIGGVDQRRRPLLRVPVPGKDDILTIIDTAFTGEVLMDEDTARIFDVLLLDVGAAIELGDGTRRDVNQGLLTVVWFGTERDVTVQVVPRDPLKDRRIIGDGEPGALLGTELIAPDRLTIDSARA
jgi:hypothetical protein